MLENMDMQGRVKVALTDREGNVVYEKSHRNRIVKAGRQLVAQLFGGITVGAPPSKVTHMGVGIGPAAATDDQTDLATARGPRNPIATVAYSEVIDSSSGSPVKRIKASLQTVFDFAEANGPEPLREAAIFTGPTGGVMYNRVVFDAVTKTNTFKLTLIWDIVF
jgi:hypothetical protein